MNKENGNETDNWMQTYTGKKFYPLKPEKSKFCIEDIAHALSNICRFTGHCREFFSVAQHSVLVSQTIPSEYALLGLLHDASEAYLTDVARPIKQLPALSKYRILEDRIQKLIYKTFGVNGCNEYDGVVELKIFDNLILRNEAKCLNLLKSDWKHYELRDLKLKIKPLLPKKAERAFLSRYSELKKI